MKFKKYKQWKKLSPLPKTMAPISSFFMDGVFFVLLENRGNFKAGSIFKYCKCNYEIDEFEQGSEMDNLKANLALLPNQNLKFALSK